MASLHKQAGKPFWFCAFTTPDGKRHFKSTRTAEKKAAQQICRTWANAALHGDGLTIDKAREIITRGVEEVMLAVGQTMPSAKTQEWCDRWLKTKALESEPGTHSRYELAIRSFTDFLGDKADKDLGRLRSDDILKYREYAAGRLSVASVNTNLRVIRACLNAAQRADLIDRNPASKVATLKESGESKRRELTDTELREVLAVCGDSEWRGLVLTGLYTGQRLGDCARITWQQVDLAKNEIWFVTQKTGKRLSFSLAKPLAAFFLSLPSSDSPAAPIFPRFSAMADKSISSLSNAFALEILIPAKLMPPRNEDKKSEGKGRSGKRVINAVTFHSLRHSFTSMLKRAGASNAIAQLIVGHDSTAVSRRYTHMSANDTIEAIDRLPDVTAP
jgi:integrase